MFCNSLLQFNVDANKNIRVCDASMGFDQGRGTLRNPYNSATSNDHLVNPSSTNYDGRTSCQETNHLCKFTIYLPLPFVI